MECWDEINNKCGPGRALSALVGRLFDRPTSVRRAIDGFAALLEKGFHLDGFCTESPSYSDMFLHLMRHIPDLLAGYSDPEDYAPAQGERIVDFDPYAHFERYRLALESMIRMLDPNLKYPVIGDSHAGGGLQPIHAEVLTAHYGAAYAGLLEKTLGAPLAAAGSPAHVGQGGRLLHQLDHRVPHAEPQLFHCPGPQDILAGVPPRQPAPGGPPRT